MATTAIQQNRYPFNHPVPSGDLRIGTAFTGEPVLLDSTQLTKHLLAIGQSGSGKTTFFYNLMRQLRTPWWSFDLKQDYRHLLQHDPDLLVLPWTQLKFNPLKPPPNTSPRRWIQLFSEIFGHATDLLSGSKNYLIKQLTTLYKLYGLFDDVSPPFPSLHELQRLIEENPVNYVRKTSNYRDTVLNRLEAINLAAGTIFDCSTGHNIIELLKRNVVFELDGLNRDIQNFLMETLLAYVYEYRLNQDHRNQGLKHVFFLDEAKQVFSVYKERQDAAGIPEIDRLTAKMREFGESLVVADQEASKLTDSIKANTHTKLLLPTGSQKEQSAITQSIDLTHRQKQFLQQLSTGQAILQTGDQEPIPVDLDRYQLDKNISDRELEKLQTPHWNQLSHQPRDTTPRFNEAILNQPSQEKQIPDDPQPEIDLSDNADRLLKDIIENPFQPLTERYQQFSSTYKGNQAKTELVEQSLVAERRVKNGENRKLLELTDKGRSYAEKQLGLDVEHQGRGGIVHRYWQHRIKDRFEEAGWDAFIEKFDADVYVNMGNTELAVEVAMGDNPREIEHVEKHLDRGFQAWIVCRSKQIQQILQEKTTKQGLDVKSVSFRLFCEMF